MHIIVKIIYVFYLLILLGCQRSITDQNQIPKEAICPTDEPQLPLLDHVKQEFGYLKVKRGELFYWYFESEETPDSTPLVIVFGGGPGGSALSAVFNGVGPYRINPDMTIYKNPYTWTKKAHMLFIDQPVGVGFSNVNDASSHVVNENQLAEDMLTALEGFLTKHPTLNNRPLYFSSGSFGSVYISWITKEILAHNEDLLRKPLSSETKEPINLQGVLIVDGVLDMLLNDAERPAYAFAKGLINKDEFNYAQSFVPQCEQERLNVPTSLKQLVEYQKPSCDILYFYMLDKAKHVNLYNVQQSKINQNGDESLTCYLRSKSTMDFLKAHNQNWEPINRTVNTLLNGYSTIPITTYILNLLNHKIRVAIFNGSEDLLMPHTSTERWLQEIAEGKYGDWNGRIEYLTSKTNKLLLDNKLVGAQRSGGLLSYTRVDEAGHRVPFDQPEVAQWLFNSFITDVK